MPNIYRRTFFVSMQFHFSLFHISNVYIVRTWPNVLLLVELVKCRQIYYRYIDMTYRCIHLMLFCGRRYTLQNTRCAVELPNYWNIKLFSHVPFQPILCNTVFFYSSYMLVTLVSLFRCVGVLLAFCMRIDINAVLSDTVFKQNPRVLSVNRSLMIWLGLQNFAEIRSRIVRKSVFL